MQKKQYTPAGASRKIEDLIDQINSIEIVEAGRKANDFDEQKAFELIDAAYGVLNRIRNAR